MDEPVVSSPTGSSLAKATVIYQIGPVFIATYLRNRT